MKTKRILTSQAVPGMIVADDVYTFNNQLIIAKNSTLTNRTITRLKFYSINDIRIIIDDMEASGILPEAESPAPDKPAPVESFCEHVKKTPEFKRFTRKFDKTLNSLESSFLQLKEDRRKPVDTGAMLEETNKILATTRNGIHVFHILQSMRNYDDLTFAHSLSVSLICNVMGHWLKLPAEDINILTTAGILHDLGKLFIPREIITKPAGLTEEEYDIVKNHPQQGYNALKNQKLDSRIKYAVLMHHERCDGSGYPNGLMAPQIDDFAKIVAIADVYEAMTAPRVYRAAICPFEVIRVFETEGLQKFDPHFLLTFLEGMARTYIDHSIRLNDGREGVIIMINAHDLSRPVVQCGDEFLDLAKEKNLMITAVI